MLLYVYFLSGSPPHLRGKLTLENERGKQLRITPAPAGKTKVFSVCYFWHEDHPRTCGENCCVVFRQSRCIGSPPHLRGKHRQQEKERESLRITPAPAGKTMVLTMFPKPPEDHPRTCGENISSNPLMKNTPGITPAPAGKTGLDAYRCKRV